MKKRNIFLVLPLMLIGVLLSSNYLYAQTSSTVSLDVLIKEALDNNPEIQRAYHKWKASEHKIKNVRGLPDPNLSYGYFGENVETRVGPQEQKFGVNQKVPFPGKLKRKGEVQAKEAQIAKETYEAVRSEVVKNVKFAFYDIYWLDKALEVNEEEKTILEDIENVAQRKYESNLSSQQDVIKLQVELSKIIEKIYLIKQNRKSVVARMNRLLDRNSDAFIGIVAQIEKEDFPYTLEEMLEKSTGSRQELLAANLSVEKSEFEKSLAKMDYLPDFTFGYEYIEVGGGTTTSIDDGKDAWVGKISVNVPIWFGKIDSGIKEKEEELKAARKKQEVVENLVAYEVQDLYFKITTYGEIVSLYETALVPQAQQAFEASQTGFETGSISFLDWLDAQRTYLQTRLAYYKSVTDYQKSIAFLERVIGEKTGGYHEE